MTPTELAGLIEGAKELREDYARRIREIDEEIAKMTAACNGARNLSATA